MCGIVGGLKRGPSSEKLFNDALEMMAHRGPDNTAVKSWCLNDTTLYFGHARLSVIDLNENASQPFQSSCGNYHLVFNGEIYNYRELREELVSLGANFRTESDTEVLLNALMVWGVECFHRLVGMFAFAFYDVRNNSLTLARDAFGIKPLYYSFEQQTLNFASELRPLLKIRDQSVLPNLQRAYDYLVHGHYDSSPETFVDGVMHLGPGQFLQYDLSVRGEIEPKFWWKPDITATSDLSFDEAAKKLRALFLDSIKLHLRSDVPLGVALSGGVDSSAIASAVRYVSPDITLKTFSYIASDERISEEKWIDDLNSAINAESHKIDASAEEMAADLDRLITAQGEPFSSTSIYAQYRVFRLAKDRGITVTLDGQGADELLAGYSGYPGQKALSLIETKGLIAAHNFAKNWAALSGGSYAFVWKSLARLVLPEAIYEFSRKMGGRDFKPAWLNTEYLEGCGVKFNEIRPALNKENKGMRVKEELARSLIGLGLPKLLRHGDRNSMAFSIESRVPFLTLPIAEFLLSLPEDYLISDEGVTKNIFREAMRGIVPDSHLDRKDKIGFETPEAGWLIELADNLKNWVDDSSDLPFINMHEIKNEINEILQGRRSYDGRLWRKLNYIRWYKLLFASV